MKKLCAMFLCITMLLSLVCVAQAATSLNLADTFDDLAVGNITAADIAAYSNAFDNCNYFRPKDAQISITADGYKGNAVTFVENGGEACLIDIRNGNANASFAPTAAEPVYLSFKMKIVNSINNTERFHIVTSNNSTLMLVQNNGGNYLWWNQANETGTRFKCVEGEWVDVQVKMTTGKTEIKVSDMHGNVNTSYRDETSAFIRITNASKIEGSSFALDEIRIIQGDGTDALNITASSYGSSPSTKTVVANETFEGWTSGKLETYMATSGNWASKYIYDGERSTITREECDGNISPAIKTLGSYKPNGASKSTTFETGVAYTAFDFKITNDLRATDTSAGTSIAQLGVNDYNEYLWVHNGNFRLRPPFTDGKAVAYTRDVWYTIVTTFENKGTTNHLTIKIYDKDGNVVLSDEADTTAITFAAVWFEGYGITDAEFCIDNVKVIHEESTVSNIINGSVMTEILGGKSKENLSTTTPAVKVSFDGIVADGSTAKFVSADKEIAATVKFTGSSLVEIAPVTPLDYDTSYTLDLSGIKGLNNQGLATGSTTALSLKTPVYSVGTMAVGTPAYNGTQVTVPVTFTNENVEELNATVIAALFSGENSDKLVWAQTKNIVAGKMGENEFTFTNLPENVGNMELKVFAWDNFDSLKPLYKK